MAYPPGVSLAVLEAGSASTFFGGAASLVATVTPILLDSDGHGMTHVVHAATGHLMLSAPESFKADQDTVLSFSVPHVDQAGWQDPSGNAFTMWAYRVQITATVGAARSAKKLTWTKNIQPIIGQDFIDIDLVGDGEVGAAVSAPQAAVLSVNGQTGHIVLSGDGATDEALEANLADAKLYTDEQVATARIARGVVPDGADLNDYYTSEHNGVWSLSDTFAYVNAPFTGAGVLTVETSGITALHTAVRYGFTEIYTRAIRNYYSTPKLWRDWDTMGTVGQVEATVNTKISDSQVGVEIPSGTNLATYRTLGLSRVPSSTVAGTLEGLPSGQTTGVLWQGALSGTSSHLRLWIGKETPGLFWQSTISGMSPLTWSGWASAGGNGGTANVVDRNSALRDRFKRGRGGAIGTGGKAAIALRFDHGTMNFRDKVLPLLRQYGIPATVAYYSGMFTVGNDPASNTDGSIDWTHLQTWGLQDGIEPANHSHTHRDATNTAELTAEIVDSAAFLRANMPKLAMEGWLVPGVAGTNYGGFDAGGEPAKFTDTEAGKLILNHHAWSSGQFGGIIRPIDGTIYQGSAHYTWEATGGVAAAQSRVEHAIDSGAGLCLMVHPSLVDTPNHVTTADLNTMFAWLAAQRDAGLIELVTVGGLTVADASSSKRTNLIRRPDFSITSRFAGTAGYTFAGGVASGSTSAGLLVQNVDLSRTDWAKGRPYMLTAQFRAPEGAVVRVLARDSVNAATFQATRDVTLPASTNWVTVHQPMHIPLTGTSIIRAEFGRVSGGALDVRNPGLLAI